MRAFTAALDLRRYVGRWSLRSASHAGRFFFMLLDLVRGILEWRVWVPRTFDLTLGVGYGSLFIVLVVAGVARAPTTPPARVPFPGQPPLFLPRGLNLQTSSFRLCPALPGPILPGPTRPR